jgi:D-alanyl-D-alanine carboxypeptidase
LAAFVLGVLSASAMVIAGLSHVPSAQAAAVRGQGAAPAAGPGISQAQARRPAASSGAAVKPRFATTWLDAHPSPELGARMKAAVVVDLDANQVLWAKDDRSRRAPASVAKLMTAMVAVDHASLEQQVTVPAEATQVEPNWMGVGAGEVLTVGELLYGLLLDSGNDAAETLARTLMARPAFLAEMNAKAARLGMRSSHFANPSGLDDPELYSTAYDLAVMAGHLIDNYPGLVAITAAAERSIPATPTHKAFAPYNLNGLVRRYPGATGMKTGYTDDAGGCLAASASRGDRRLVAVILNSDAFGGDAVKLLDYGFTTQLLTRSPALP